jgi:hypothetical protein
MTQVNIVIYRGKEVEKVFTIYILLVIINIKILIIKSK